MFSKISHKDFQDVDLNSTPELLITGNQTFPQVGKCLQTIIISMQTLELVTFCA